MFESNGAYSSHFVFAIYMQLFLPRSILEGVYGVPEVILLTDD